MPYVPQIIGGWMLLIFCYALFVPNTWRRAAVVIGLMAAAPIARQLFAYWRSNRCRQLLVDEHFGGVRSPSSA